MASPRPESVDHRASQLRIRNGGIRELLRLWRLVDITELQATLPLFLNGVPDIVVRRFGLSAQAAVRYYQRLRPGGEVTVLGEPVPPDTDETVGLTRGAGISGIVNARRAGFPPQAALRNGFVKVAGATSNLILAGGRQTILQATQSDPTATGRWRRVAGGQACDFCKTLEGRGFVFTEATGGFQAHDHDGCSIEPEFTAR